MELYCGKAHGDPWDSTVPRPKETFSHLARTCGKFGDFCAYYLDCVCICVPECLYVHQVCSVFRYRKTVSDTLELELQMGVNI